jgi:CelD/BcsL family acetyltransferase involved in cellulose biosynthesis
MYTVDVREGSQLDGLQSGWAELLERCVLPTPFLTWEWLTTWQRCFAAGARLVVLCVWDGSHLRGLLPLTQRPGSMLQPVLMFAGVQAVGADHVDLICAPADADGCLLAIIAFMRSGGLSWRELRLPLVAEDSHLMRGMRQQGRDRVSIRQASLAPFMQLSRSYDQFLAGLSSNERYKLRQRTRKLLEQQGAAYASYGPEQYAQALSSLFALHRLRATEKGMRSAFDSEAVERFHARLLSVLPPEQVVLRGLEVEGRAIAMFYGFRVAGRLYYFQLGYDPAWAAFSPGIVIITKTVEEACETGCVEYNFLQGDEAFKQIWTRQSRTLFDIVVYNRSFAGVVARQAAQAVSLVKSGGRPGVAATGSALKPAAGRDGTDANAGSAVAGPGSSNG